MYYNDYSLQLLYEKAKKNKAIICGGGKQVIKIDKNQTVYSNTTFKFEGFMYYKDYQYDYDYQRFIYNKNFLKRYKLYFPRYLRYQDPPFFIKAMATAKKFYMIKTVTSVFRKTSQKVFSLKQVIDIFYGINDCLRLEEKLHLYKLYNITLNRLNMKYLLKEIKKYSDNMILKDVILKVITSINQKIIKKNDLNFVIDNFYKKITKINI